MKWSMIRKLTLVTVACCAVAAPVKTVLAAEGAATPPNQSWSFEGPFGQYDKAALQRGFLVYKNVCSACHSMKYMSYRNLDALGYSEEQIKSIASEYMIQDGPDDEGEYFERPGRPSDRFKSPFENSQQAKAANGGAEPPDMSLLVHARPHGADYIYALIAKGFDDSGEHHMELSAGQYYNKYMLNGNVISMTPPLSDGLVSYPDGSPETVDQYARDVAEFLQYASDPHMEARKEVGIRVMIFLFFFCLVFYMAKKKLWKDVH